MNTETHKATKDQNGKTPPDTGSTVTITVNNDPVEIHRGRQTVADIKTQSKVPLADELEQLIEGKLTPLADDAAVTLKGGEVFISHVRDGQSS